MSEISPTERPNPYVGRGGLKLEAGLKGFKLGRRVRGVRALDLGAGTGGFTDCLLQFGAGHVTAVDVGHGQLAERLRQDKRVTVLEKTQLKRAPLTVAPGPFDFFVLDVSFASARSMLRPIAARLKPQAEGVVLLKPQFELPKPLVPAGGVIESRNLRKFAFNRFKKKARLLGFEVLGKMNSPVPGGSGTIEMLLHVRWQGVPEADTKPA